MHRRASRAVLGSSRRWTLIAPVGHIADLALPGNVIPARRRHIADLALPGNVIPAHRRHIADLALPGNFIPARRRRRRGRFQEYRLFA
ncbi:MAG: hypothetical protein J7559_05300 [Cohnella sp.]|nr:hypothetical protein [Cohnella sp.]